MNIAGFFYSKFYALLFNGAPAGRQAISLAKNNYTV
jgi:hypothetical protein